MTIPASAENPICRIATREGRAAGRKAGIASSATYHLGAVLLLADRPSEAEAVYRADLLSHPDNGWALTGLIQSLRAQQKDDQVAEAEAALARLQS